MNVATYPGTVQGALPHSSSADAPKSHVSATSITRYVVMGTEELGEMGNWLVYLEWLGKWMTTMASKGYVAFLFLAPSKKRDVRKVFIKTPAATAQKLSAIISRLFAIQTH